MLDANCDNMSHAGNNLRMAKVRVRDKKAAKHRKEMGARMRMARTAVGLEADEVAKTLGVPPNTYMGWERGRTALPYYQLAPFCRLTHTGPTFISTGTPNHDWNDEGGETGRFPKIHPED